MTNGYYYGVWVRQRTTPINHTPQLSRPITIQTFLLSLSPVMILTYFHLVSYDDHVSEN